MKLLFVADLHYTLKQFDWVVANAGDYDWVVIGGDLLDLASALDFDLQIVVVEKYLARLRQQTRVLVSSGNHDGDARNAADEMAVRPGSSHAWDIGSWLSWRKVTRPFQAVRSLHRLESLGHRALGAHGATTSN